MSIFRYPLVIFLILGLAAHASVLRSHFQGMWESNSFRFFPLAFIAAAYVAYRRKDRLKSTLDETETGGVNAFALASLMFFCSLTAVTTAILATPTLGWISFLLFLSVVLYAGNGVKALTAFWPSIVILAMVRCIPDSIEANIVTGFQTAASLLASKFMDAIGMVHIREGGLLSLAGPRFDAEEASSGIRSLFSSLTLVFAWGILKNYGWVRHVFNFVQTIFWVVVMNAVKLVAILVFQSRTSISIAEGIPLEIASVITFLVIIGLVLSTDQLTTAFFGNENIIETDGTEFGSEFGSEAETNSDAFLATRSGWTWPLGNVAAVAWMIGLGIAAAVSVRMLTLPSKDSLSIARLLDPTKELLGDQIEGWNVTKFSQLERSKANVLGKEAYQWTLRKGLREAQLSLGEAMEGSDSPQDYFALRGWLCVKTVGKLRSGALTISPEPEPSLESHPEPEHASQATLEGSYTQIQLTKENGESGVVLFTSFDSSGNDLPPKIADDFLSTGYWTSRLASGIGILIGKEEQAIVHESNPSVKLRLTCIPNIDLKSEDLEELKRLFATSIDQLRKSPFFTSVN